MNGSGPASTAGEQERVWSSEYSQQIMQKRLQVMDQNLPASSSKCLKEIHQPFLLGMGEWTESSEEEEKENLAPEPHKSVKLKTNCALDT